MQLLDICKIFEGFKFFINIKSKNFKKDLKAFVDEELLMKVR